MRARAVAAAAAGLLAAAPPPGLSPPFPAPARALAQVAAPAAVDVGQLVNQNLLQDRQTLLGGRTQTEQDEAARRLVGLQSPDARRYLLEALRSIDRPRAQLAAAKALADDPTPDPQAVDPLAALLGAERLTDIAATAALLNQRTDAALGRVFSFVSAESASTSTIKALGMSTDKRVAEKLVELVQAAPTDRNQTKRNYAADALVEMTGLTDNGRNPAAWGAWWRANVGKPADQFRAELLERNRRRRPAALADVEPLVGDLYRLAADKDKATALLRILSSADAPFRAAGARLVYTVFSTSYGQVPAGAVARVRELLRDSSPEVRLEAARTLQNLNDRPALYAVLAQMRVETDAEVRLALMQALVPMQDPRAAPELVRLLKSDPSVRTATVAAETLAKIGSAVRADPALLATTVNELKAAMASRAAQDPTGDLRGACVEAMVPLKDPQLLGALTQLMVDRGQPARVRKAALAAVGELGNQGTAATVMEIARNDREPPDVRVAALGAMERLADAGFAAALFGLSRQTDVDPQVRRAAAKATEVLLPQVGDDQLAGWASQLQNDGNFAGLIPVKAEVLKRAKAAQPPTKPPELAAAYIALGDAYVRAARPAEGIESLQLALNIYLGLRQAQPAAGPAFNQNITQCWLAVIGACLAAERYDKAVEFAGKAVGFGESQAEMLPPIGKELDRLNKERQPIKVRLLATEALNFKQLDPGFQKWFKDNLEAARPAGPGAAPVPGPGGPGPGGR